MSEFQGHLFPRNLGATGTGANVVTGTGASTEIAFWNGMNSITGSSSFLFGSGNVALGTTLNSTTGFGLTESYTISTNVNCYGINLNLNILPTADTLTVGTGNSITVTTDVTATHIISGLVGTFIDIGHNPNTNAGGLTGIQLQIFNNATTAAMGAMLGATISLNNSSSGLTSSVTGIDISYLTTGPVTVAYGLHIETPTVTVAPTNSYGIYIENQTTGGNIWAIQTNLGLVQFGDSVLVQPAALTSGSPAAFKVQSASHTGLTAAGWNGDIYFNINSAIQFTTANPTALPIIQINTNRTISFVGASTVTYCTGTILGSFPQPGTNATFTNVINVLLGQSNMAGSATNIYNTVIVVPGINTGFGNATNLFGLYFFNSGNVSLGNQTATLTNLALIDLPIFTYTSTTNTRTVTNPASFIIEGAPAAGSNVTFTNGPYSFWVKAGTSRLDALFDISAIAAGSDNIKITKTNATPSTTWTAGVPSNNPNGYLQINVAGSGSRYIPFWT